MEYLFVPENKYNLLGESKILNSDGMINYLAELVKSYPIYSIEDGMAEDDWKGWSYMSKNISRITLMIGDDLFVTNKKRLL